MSKTRGHGEGTVRKRGDGRWEARLGLPGGKPKYFYGKTRREALQKLQEAHVERSLGRLSIERSDTVEVYLRSWLETKRPNIKPRTAEIYELNIGRLVAHIGSVHLDALEPVHVQRCYAELGKQLAPYSVRQAHRLLHAALKQAVLWNILPRNVAEAVVAPKPRTTEMTILTPGQLMALFEATKDDRFHNLWVLLGTTGLRIGEALALKWSDIEWERKSLLVRRTVQRQQEAGLVFEDTKTAGSRRTVELPEESVAALRDQRVRQLKVQLGAGPTWEDNDLVFSTETGKPFDRGRIHYNFRNALKKTDLPHMRPHDLRHTAASILLHELGLPVKLVSEMLGHANVTTTLAVYGHLMPTMHRDAANRLDALFATHREHA